MGLSLPQFVFPENKPAGLAWMTELLGVLVEPGGLVELVALDVSSNGKGRTHTESGFYDTEHLGKMAEAALALSRNARGVYWTLNPLRPELLARRCNRTDWAGSGDRAGDTHVIARRWLMVDIDPVRDGKISATDAEKLLAWESAVAIREFLSGLGWPEPLVGDSGNGFHLLYRIDLPADDGGLIKTALEKLARRFDTPHAVVDRSVFNPARLCKVPGTWARKGDDTPDRPHRRSAIIERPKELAVVTREQLIALPDVESTEEPPEAEIPLPRGARAGEGKRLRVGDWLTDRGVEFRVKERPDSKGRTVYVLAVCPFNPAHRDPDACVMQAPDGMLSAKCFHASCTGFGWKAFKGAIGRPDPHHFDGPPTARRRPPAQNVGVEEWIECLGESGPPGEGPPGDDEGEPREPSPPPRPVVLIDPASLTVEASIKMISDRLFETGDCFRRAGQLVRVDAGEIHAVLGPAALGGLLNRSAEVRVVEKRETTYKPLPTNYANIWLNRPGEIDRLPLIRMFTANPVFTEDWRLSPPGYDPATGIYYAGPEINPSDRLDRLTALLGEFCFRGAADRTNYAAMLVTAVLMPRFIGSKPAAVLNGNQPGLGKSVLAQLIAVLRDGRAAETVSYNPNDEEFEKRLGAQVRSGATTLIIDNAKGSGRAPRIESACLERSITDPILSFRLLGQSDRIRTENSHIFCLTANSPELSRDLITRSVSIALHHEGDPARREFVIPDPEQYALDHRSELLAELIGMVERWRAGGSPLSPAKSRFNKKGWGPIVGGVLEFNGFEDFLGNSAAAAIELDETRRGFGELVERMARDPAKEWSSSDLANLAERSRLFGKRPGDFDSSLAIQIGLWASRYIGEYFPLHDGRTARFRRIETRRGNRYALEISSEPTDRERGGD